MLLLAGLAVVVGGLQWHAGRRRKALAVALVTNRALVAHNARFPMRIHYGDVTVSQPRLLVLAIGNIGNVPVARHDFETPLGVALGSATVLDATVSRTRPTDLQALLTHSDGKLALQPLLLNPGDSLELQCLLDGHIGAVDVVPTGRISGVSSLPLLSVPRTSWDEPYRVSRIESAISIGAAAIFAGVLVMPTWSWPPSPNTYLAAAAALLAMGLFAAYVIRKDRRSRLFLTF